MDIYIILFIIFTIINIINSFQIRLLNSIIMNIRMNEGISRIIQRSTTLPYLSLHNSNHYT